MIHVGDALKVLQKMPDESVQCCVTSLPYYGLRSYGTKPQIWGGDPKCAHRWGAAIRTPWANHVPGPNGAKKNGAHSRQQEKYTGPFCVRCGAWRGELGLEPTPQLYTEHVVSIFAEVRRVLKNDGTLWLNCGDSYATGGGKVGDCPGGGKQGERWTGARGANPTNSKRGLNIGPLSQPNRMPLPGLKPKDLIGVPWMLAFALRADGYYLRSDIIWHKPNPMPESVTDRPTKAHEYLFLLTKSARYFYDAEAIAERALTPGDARHLRTDRRKVVQIGCIDNGSRVRTGSPTKETRNCRTVWTVTTKPFKGAHFATFPPKLIEPCILAGSRPSGKRCDCDDLILTPTGTGAVNDPTKLIGRAGFNRPRRDGEGSRPITKREQRSYAQQMKDSPHRASIKKACGAAFSHYIRTDFPNGARPLPGKLLDRFRNRGWLVEPSPCRHQIEPADTILDPFAGAGTTWLVAQQYGRQFIGIELNAAYAKMARDRVKKAAAPLLLRKTA